MTKKEIEFYENTDFGDERYGAKVTVHPDESAIDVIKRLRAERKKTTVSMRLPNSVISKAKDQAATAGIPWTSYISAIVEQAVLEPQTHTG